MKGSKFRVYCEFELDGKLHKSMESEASWFLLTQAGELLVHHPCQPVRQLEKKYKKAIPLFFTGFNDDKGAEIFMFEVNKGVKSGLSRAKSYRAAAKKLPQAYEAWRAAGCPTAARIAAGNGGGSSGDASQSEIYERAFAEFRDSGMSKTQSHRQAARQYPKAHAAWLENYRR